MLSQRRYDPGAPDLVHTTYLWLLDLMTYETFQNSHMLTNKPKTASHDDESRDASRQHTQSSTSIPSPRLGPRGPEVQSPPLTPAATDGTLETKQTDPAKDSSEKLTNKRDVITPQESGHETSPQPATRRLPHRQSSEEGKRSTSEYLGAPDHRKGMFSVGPGSLPVSRESSPNRASALYSRPFTPSGDADNPYAASKRQPQAKIEPRFVFSRKKGKVSPSSSTLSLPKVAADKRQSSGLLSALGKNSDVYQTDSHGTTHSRQGSMSDLKRFFKMGGHHKAKRAASPAASIRSGYRTPPGSRSTSQIPFGDDHGLTSKYGKLGKVLGSGAGGSVRLMKRSEDNTVFAVKEFRPRHSYETEKEYVKKLTAEYCIGSSLHHGNIIETLDIVQEKNKWFEVMEYAPYDLFAIVMTGKMSREEVSCCFLQILSGVTYLHSMGLAHRDLKLDNVVVNDRGIMKIIDFGSAHVFKYPFENNIVLASGKSASITLYAPPPGKKKKKEGGKDEKANFDHRNRRLRSISCTRGIRGAKIRPSGSRHMVLGHYLLLHEFAQISLEGAALDRQFVQTLCSRADSWTRPKEADTTAG
jgi:hypothetical protein